MKHVFHNIEQATIYVCAAIRKRVLEDININNKASLVLTGGTTIISFLKNLAKIDLPWEKVYITLSDERWVDVNHELSNEKQLREHFLQFIPNVNFISLKTNHLFTNDALAEVAQRFYSILQPFSYVLLSMGEDGHVASLFENTELEEQQSIVCCSYYQRIHRISLSMQTLLNTKHLAILVSGFTRQDLLGQMNMQHYLWNLYKNSEKLIF